MSHTSTNFETICVHVCVVVVSTQLHKNAHIKCQSVCLYATFRCFNVTWESCYYHTVWLCLITLWLSWQMFLQDTTHLIQRPCHQRGSACHDSAGNRTTRRPPDHRRKLQWYGHVSRSPGLAKTILQGAVKGRRRLGRQRKRWEDNIREWTGLAFAKSQRAVENRAKWRKVVVKSSVVPQRPSRLRERWWWWWWCLCMGVRMMCGFGVYWGYLWCVCLRYVPCVWTLWRYVCLWCVCSNSWFLHHWATDVRWLSGKIDYVTRNC